MEKYAKLADKVAIPVERIQCPLLVITGEADDVHPATLHGELIMERLDKHNSKIKRKHLHYSYAGHSPRTPYESKIDLPWFLTKGVYCSAGGTIQGNARAAKTSWLEMINFLRETLVD